MPGTQETHPAYLLLEDGHFFKGTSFGKKGTSFGELCFNTGMTGYQEVFTDPSYFGQVIIMNNVHTGDYGVAGADEESDGVKVKAVIGRRLESRYSRFKAEGSLQDYFESRNIVAIEGIDTRALVAHVRQKGAMNCIVSSEISGPDELKKHLAAAPSMKGLELASAVSTSEPYEAGDPASSVRIAALDFGIKKNIIRCMVERGAFVKVFPARTTFSDMQAFKPDGYFLSNGPGDPEPMDYAVKTAQEIMKSGKPLFGICLGHQILALANGIPTFKMHHGHRGLNHPVRNMITGRCEITTQNHGFGVDPDAVRKNIELEITHMNLNDQSIEGIRVKGKPFFSVQYHPESAPGPHDSRYLFDDFLAMIHAQKQKA